MRNIVGSLDIERALPGREPDGAPGIDQAARDRVQSGTKHFHEIGAGIEGKRDDEARGRAIGEAADARDAVEHQIDQQDQRHVADEFDIGRDQRADDAAPPVREQREREADDDARGDADRRELEAERQSPPQPAEVAPDDSEVEVVAARAAPAPYMGGNPVTRGGRFSPKNSL